MSWLYEIISGRLYDDGNNLVGVGYSGNPAHKNDPSACALKDQGPIPPGSYTIQAPQDTVTHGPFVLPLQPFSSNEMYGRSGFLMHGDSVVNPGTASEGCVIQSRDVREQVWASGDRVLSVVAQIADPLASVNSGGGGE